MRCLPTKPLELASPLGKRLDLELSSRRGVPTPLHARITVFARCSYTRPSASKYTAPAARPRSSTVISRTRAWVRSSTPASIAGGQYVTCALDNAPMGHPMSHGPHAVHTCLPG